MRCTPVRYTFIEVHTREMYAHEVHAYEVHTYEIHVHEIHALGAIVPGVHTSVQINM